MEHAKDYGLSAEKVGYDAKAVVDQAMRRLGERGD